MLHSVLTKLDEKGLIGKADAHCDIPCGIYDPMPALIAALTVIRVMDLIHEGKGDPGSAAAMNSLARNIANKEEHAEKVKHEIRVIWGDYFKAPMIEKHPHVHGLVHSIMQKASACKQDVHREDAVALLDLVNEFAELFWKTKEKDTKRVEAAYPPNLPIVYPVL